MFTIIFFALWFGVCVGAVYLLNNYVMPLVLDAKLTSRGVEVVFLRVLTVWRVPYDDITSAERLTTRLPLFGPDVPVLSLATRSRPRVLLRRRFKRPLLLAPRDTEGFIRAVNERKIAGHGADGRIVRP